MIFGVTFLQQTYLRVRVRLSSKTFLSSVYVAIMQFVFKYATSGGRFVNRFNFQINTSFNYNRRLKR